MKRRREQRGTVYAKSGMWYVRYSDFRVSDGQLERKRLAKQLGSVTDLTKKEARADAKNFLAKINQPTLTPETAVTFTAFVESVYMPRVEQRLRPSTYRGYKVLWREIKPFCDGLWTRDIRTRHVQAILDAMAKTDRFNNHSMKHIKSFLSGSFASPTSRAITKAPILSEKLRCPRHGRQRRLTPIPLRKFLR